MEFEWDEAKSARNRVTRELPFELSIRLFYGPVIEVADSRHDYGEERMRAIGVVGELVLVCVFTNRGPTRRIISLRRANRRERDAYRAAFPR